MYQQSSSRSNRRSSGRRILKRTRSSSSCSSLESDSEALSVANSLSSGQPARTSASRSRSRTPHVHEGYDVGVFWDYENVRIPRWCRTADAANAIRSAVIGYGRISERRLYYDSKKISERYTDRVNLDLSGFTLVDCPSRGRKETLDKRMIVDILGFAWERAARHIPTCVVLITSDGDYSYTVAKLRDIGVCTVIIYGERTTTADVLLDACDHALSWIFDVLQRPTHDEDQAAEQDGDNDKSGDGPLVMGLRGMDTDSTDDSAFAAQQQAVRSFLNSETATSSLQSGQDLFNNGAGGGNVDMVPLSRETSLSEAREGRHLLFLNCVSIIQVRQLSKLISSGDIDEDNEEADLGVEDSLITHQDGGNSRGSVTSRKRAMWESCWALDSQVVQLFNTKRGLHGNELNNYYKELRKSAVNAQFIRVGRQDADTGEIIDVTSGDSASLTSLKPQQYLQLTVEGREQLTGGDANY